MSFLLISLVAISLSMDTFSLSLTYGMLNIEKKHMILISICVGIFHFFMPIFGNLFGKIIFKIIPIEENVLIAIVFLTISVEIIFSLLKDQGTNVIKNIFDILLFSFTVSIDSFATGTCIDVFNTNKIIVSLIFMIFSFSFTFFGLFIGKYIHNKIGKISEIIGIIMLISLSIFYLIY